MLADNVEAYVVSELGSERIVFVWRVACMDSTGENGSVWDTDNYQASGEFGTLGEKGTKDLK